MQMFVLDVSPVVSASYLADVHVRVICREVTMCLSSWYAKHMGHLEELPYKPFNHPVVEQFDCVATRVWAALNAFAVFMEFEGRFGKEHASFAKFQKLTRYRALYHDNPFPVGEASVTQAHFSFIEKGVGVQTGLTIDEAVAKHRTYYKQKLATMRVPVIYTKRPKPDWLEENIGGYNEHCI